MQGVPWKRAAALQAGDLIVTSVPGHAAFVDRVCEVRFARDGKVHVDLNHWTATTIYPEAEQVRVIARRSQLMEATPK